MNTDKYKRYRAADLIRFPTDSTYVFLLPGSDIGSEETEIELRGRTQYTGLLLTECVCGWNVDA